MFNFLKNLFGTKQERDLKLIYPIVDEINVVHETLVPLTDDELKLKTIELKNTIKEHNASIEEEIQEKKNTLADLNLSIDEAREIKESIEELELSLQKSTAEILQEILPTAYAVVKDTCRRLTEKKHTYIVSDSEMVWNMIPYDVQLIGGIVLHQGKISEMATGEGKTLVATLPTFLNALTGLGVHIITVNDYLAKRDKEWMNPIFEFHNLTTSVILNDMSSEERKIAYQSDITFGTNNEFGFDYLRDNMETDPELVVHRNFYYAIVDEVDSVLIDEARTPLIISGPSPHSSIEKFSDLKPDVDRLVREQQSLASKLLTDAERIISKKEKGWEETAGLCLFRAKRAQPKNKRLIKLLGETGNVQLVEQTENEYLKDNASKMNEVDAELFYVIDEKFHSIDITEKGRDLLSVARKDKDFFIIPDVGAEIALIENNSNLTDEQKITEKDKLYITFSERSDCIHNVSQLLKAYSLYEKDVEYVVQNEQVLIVDEFTGRILPGRRYSDGLHQAIETKENVKIESETQTMATITLQNYFRLYTKLAGMTGTAETEETEFYDIYKLEVSVIPTNKAMVRDDREDYVFKTKREKYNAVIKQIETLRNDGQPVLVGTTSVDSSETLSRMLKMRHVPHNVLNAKQHQREAEVISNAGKSGNVTIATNMAGRGTDIKLGEGVKEKGGLFIIGTERHESRRIDRQLRGRAGRQGDPGASQFYLSLEDDLMRLFGSDRISKVMDRLNHEEGEALQHSLITKSIERAQRKVEEQNFATRKRLLEYDNVMNQQREIIYSKRRNALFKERLRTEIFDYLYEYSSRLANELIQTGETKNIEQKILKDLTVHIDFSHHDMQLQGVNEITEKIYTTCVDFYKRKEEKINNNNQISHIEKFSVLHTIDEKWREHLRDIETIKEGVHLRAYGQKDPLLEYKQEAFKTFSLMLDEIEFLTIERAFKLYPEGFLEKEKEIERQAQTAKLRMKTMHEAPVSAYVHSEANERTPEQEVKQIPVRVEKTLGRNDPCYCGSGKKFKNCHGK